MRKLLPIPALIAGALAVAPAIAEAAPRLAEMRWQQRPLLIFAPAADDARIVRQRTIAAAAESGFRARDLHIVTVIGHDVQGATDQAAALRRRYRIAPAEFAVVLIGKDGGEKLRAPEPLPAERLFGTIDAMPMRRDEAGRQGR